MAKSTVKRRSLNNLRYRRDQRVATTGTLVLLIATAAISWLLYYRPDSPENAATSPPTASAPPLPVWLAESESSINNLVNARNNIAAAAAQNDFTGTVTACQAATGAVANLHSRMPSPLPVLTNSLQQAIQSYEIGLPYCISATQTREGEGMQRAAAYITQGDAAMQTVLDFLHPGTGTQPSQLGVLIV